MADRASQIRSSVFTMQAPTHIDLRTMHLTVHTAINYRYPIQKCIEN